LRLLVPAPVRGSVDNLSNATDPRVHCRQILQQRFGVRCFKRHGGDQYIVLVRSRETRGGPGRLQEKVVGRVDPKGRPPVRGA
jgi:hypothetical protein